VTERRHNDDVDEPHRRRRLEHTTDEQRPDDSAKRGPYQEDGRNPTGDRDLLVADPQDRRREGRRHSETGQRRRRPDNRRPDVDEGEHQQIGDGCHREVDDHHRARMEERRQRNAEQSAGEVESEEDGHQERRIPNGEIEIFDGERGEVGDRDLLDVEIQMVEEEHERDEC